MDEVRATAESVFHLESGRIIAGLIRICRSFDHAEEAMQESFSSAIANWPSKGIPQNPGAWIMATAHRKLIDAARKERTRRETQDALQYETENSWRVVEPCSEADVMEYPDERLRLIFTCCSSSA